MNEPLGLKALFAVLLSLLCVQLILGFRGAVLEHAEQSYAISSKEPEDIIQANLAYYKTATRIARSKGVDVIVFPEYGIFPPSSRSRLKQFLEFVPDPQVTCSTPCNNPDLFSKRPILYMLSCLALENSMIIVANMGDIQPCTKQKHCPKDGVFHFNTNVVFDRNGTILAKYHKEHLFGEPGMDIPQPGVQDPTFVTHLGRFATFVCFDIVFGRIVEVAHWKGVDAVLFPTMWIDSYPLYSSIHHFQAWAIGNNVTLLAANQQVPGISSIGSAIFKGSEGALVYTFNPDGQSKLLIADVQKTMGKSDLHSNIYVITKNGSKEYKEDGKNVGNACSRKVLKPAKDVYKDYRCLESDMTNFTLTKLESKMDVIHSCNNGMCCTIHYSSENIQENFYFGVSNGSFSALNRYSWAEENCFLARCDEFKNKTCVTFPTRSKTLFYDVHMTANFSTDYVYPTVISSGLRLTPRNHWKFDISKRRASISVGSKSVENLLAVGFKGRPYDRDPPYVR